MSNRVKALLVGQENRRIESKTIPALRAIGVDVTAVWAIKSGGALHNSTLPKDIDCVVALIHGIGHSTTSILRRITTKAGVPMVNVSFSEVEWPRAFAQAGLPLPAVKAPAEAPKPPEVPVAAPPVTAAPTPPPVAPVPDEDDVPPEAEAALTGAAPGRRGGRGRAPLQDLIERLLTTDRSRLGDMLQDAIIESNGGPVVQREFWERLSKVSERQGLGPLAFGALGQMFTDTRMASILADASIQRRQLHPRRIMYSVASKEQEQAVPPTQQQLPPVPTPPAIQPPTQPTPAPQHETTIALNATELIAREISIIESDLVSMQNLVDTTVGELRSRLHDLHAAVDGLAAIGRLNLDASKRAK